MEAKADVSLQQAVGVIQRLLAEVAKGKKSPPSVRIDVEWIDVSTYEGRAWAPNISISAAVTQEVDLYEAAISDGFHP